MWKFHQYLYNQQNITWPLGIRILSSRAESISHSLAALTRERYSQHSKTKFVSPRPCNILYLS